MAISLEVGLDPSCLVLFYVDFTVALLTQLAPPLFTTCLSLQIQVCGLFNVLA